MSCITTFSDIMVSISPAASGISKVFGRLLGEREGI
jgi:hypothetical protein